MSTSSKHRIAYAIAAASVIIPIVVMIWNVKLGFALLFIGLIAAYPAIRYGGRNDLHALSDAAIHKIGRHENERGRTILVQVVDDFGRELPPDTVRKLMAEAQAKASPRDMLVPVRYKIASEDDKSPKVK